MRSYLLCSLVLLLCTCVRAQISQVVGKSISQTETRWDIMENGKGVVWDVANETNLPHTDNIEMSGRGVSMVVEYSVDTNRMVSVQRRMIYPQMRPYIKDTDPAWWATYRNYLRRNYEDEEVLPKIYVGDKEITLGKVRSVEIENYLTIVYEASDGLQITRKFFPDPSKHLAFETLHFTNKGQRTLTVELAGGIQMKSHLGQEGVFVTATGTSVFETLNIESGTSQMAPIGLGAGLGIEDGMQFEEPGSAAISLARREEICQELTSNLILETPEPIYNTMFSLAKIRGAESIFDSKLGLVHSPGGERYYIGFWANDQAEYINPFFPYLGYNLGNEAALNMWRVYAKAIPEDGSNIRYAFEMEGDSPANPLDRGDAAMIAYGLSHYLLALGDEKIAEELWHLLDWCLEYNHKMLNEHGVVASESDEMEGRIETGDANLSTSSLYYGALETSISLAKSLDKDKKLVKTYQKRRRAIGENIESFFGRRVEGLETYRYFDGHTALRHWIALPLVVGLHDRKEGTLEGLFDRLWTDNGVAVEKNHPNPAISKIFWDRGTLYALRGAFLAGGTERANERLLQFSRERLLGERVPYVVEAYPEGGMAHLSAESGLYCRVFTEGVLGLLPTGFRSFRLQPQMPEDWPKMALRKIHAFGQKNGFDIEVNRKGGFMVITILDAEGRTLAEERCQEGEIIEFKL